MNIKIKLFVLIGLFLVSIMGFGFFSLNEIKGVSQLISNDIPKHIEDLTLQSELDSGANFIRYYDEILTQSARNYAFTSDKKWKERYLENEPQLDTQIKTAIEKGNYIETEFFKTINEANLNLVQMEYSVIDLVDQGKQNDAIKILESDEYWFQKGVYQEGLRNYLSARGIAYDEAILASSSTLDDAVLRTKNLVENFSNQLVFLIIMILVLTISIGFLISRSIIKPIDKLISASIQISKGGLNNRVSISGNDEFTQLGKSFNQMAESIEKSQKHLQENNITIEKQLKEIQEIDKLKSEFISMVTHEFKTPLIPILGYSTILLNQQNLNLTTDQQEAVKEIQYHGYYLEKMIDTILSVIRVEMNSLNFNYENFNINQLLLKTIDTIKETKSEELKQKQIELQFSNDDDFVVYSDSEKISKIITILVDNAISFTPKNGTIKIGIQLLESEVLVYVQDSGIGISQTIQSNLFEKKFYQVDMSDRRLHGGMGMNLVLSKLLIEKMGGRIWVESKTGKGSKFCFTISTKIKMSIEAIGVKV